MMTIYDKSTSDLIREYVASRPAQATFTTQEITGWFRLNYPRIKESTIKAHLDKMCTNFRSRIHHNPKTPDDLFFRERPGVFRRYVPGQDPEPIRKDWKVTFVQSVGAEDSPAEGGSEPVATEEDIENAAAFAQEHHLRDFLAENLGSLEPGLRLYRDESIEGVEFPIRNRRIDLLCVGRDEALVVVEVKLSRGHARAVGQLLTYMGWVRQDLAEGRPVRGIIVGKTLTDELRAAVAETRAEIGLFEYELSFKLTPVKP